MKTSLAPNSQIVNTKFLKEIKCHSSEHMNDKKKHNSPIANMEKVLVI